MKAVSNSSSQKSNTSRKADRENEIINVPMPRGVAKRLQERSLGGLENNSTPKNWLGLPKGERPDAIVNLGIGTDSEEANALYLEEYRVFEKALADGAKGKGKTTVEISIDEIAIVCEGLRQSLSTNWDPEMESSFSAYADEWLRDGPGHFREHGIYAGGSGNKDSKETEEFIEEQTAVAHLLKRFDAIGDSIVEAIAAR